MRLIPDNWLLVHTKEDFRNWHELKRAPVRMSCVDRIVSSQRLDQLVVQGTIPRDFARSDKTLTDKARLLIFRHRIRPSGCRKRHGPRICRTENGVHERFDQSGFSVCALPK
ncbi:MAG: hypothetical protein DMF90_26440 [Acidobacteria bacterium]|nr:MAG: hypothetical protein DMF90_26440 [Acidobacteriota bacterium]